MIEQGSIKPGTPIKITDSSGNVIDPATEATLKSVAGFNIPYHDRIDATYPDSVTEVYSYSTLGSPVGTITVVYSDSSKNNLVSVVKS